MTGAEIIIALVGILAGFSQCSQYAGEVITKLKQKRALARAAKQAEELQSSLRGGGSVIEDGLFHFKKLHRSTGFGQGTFGDTSKRLKWI
jgi:hypothetical protein